MPLWGTQAEQPRGRCSGVWSRNKGSSGGWQGGQGQVSRGLSSRPGLSSLKQAVEDYRLPQAGTRWRTENSLPLGSGSDISWAIGWLMFLRVGFGPGTSLNFEDTENETAGSCLQRAYVLLCQVLVVEKDVSIQEASSRNG